MAMHAPRWSHLETKQSSYNTYTPEEWAKTGRYDAVKGPSKVTKHFSVLLDGKPTCSLVMVRMLMVRSDDGSGPRTYFSQQQALVLHSVSMH